ncbi:MAG: phosphate ABC transporter substrate-binding protein PstS [Armatimonadota bacterium]
MNRRTTQAVLCMALATGAILIGGCGKSSGPVGVNGGSETKSDVTVNGAGATFPYPVYAKWADKYHQMTGIKVNYQSIGSGGGVQQIKAGTVDFGASDAPLTAKELDEAGLIQFPMIMGGVVPVVNIEGVKQGQLNLSPETLTGIYLGKIKKWNDSAITKENPGLPLPDKDITVVSRADGSGTSWIFTNYLDKVSKDWHNKVGFGKAVSWPVGVRGKGNEGVASYVQRLQGSIGYVEYAYALQSKMNYVKLKNKAGKYVEPSIETFQAAAASADWENAPGYYVVLTDEPGEMSWPITGASYIIVHKKQKDKKIADAMLGFFEWSYQHGADMAKELDYVPMPDNVVKMVQKKWKSDITH